MSSQLKEKQQQTDKSREFEADQLLNKHLFRTLAYAGAGFGAGMVASLFFKHKKMITLLGTGAGAAYGGQGFMSDYNQYQRFKDIGSQNQQSQTLKRDDQLATKNWENYMPKQETLNQQKRYGGSSDDDDDHESKTAKSKSTTSKSSEQKDHESAEAKSKTQTKSSAEPKQGSTNSGIKVDSPSTFSSDRNKDLDKTSTEFGKNKGAVAKDSSHDRTMDKSSQQFGEQKSSGVKSFNLKESIHQNQKSDSVKNHKENNSSKHVAQKSSSHTKQNELGGQQFERSGTGVSEPHMNFREEGQQLQTFSNKEAGKPAPGESTLHRGSERPRHSSRQLDELNNQQNKVEQDRLGKSSKTGNKMKLEFPNENVAGGQFSGQNLTAKSQTNVVTE